MKYFVAFSMWQMHSGLVPIAKCCCFSFYLKHMTPLTCISRIQLEHNNQVQVKKIQERNIIIEGKDMSRAGVRD